MPSAFRADGLLIKISKKIAVLLMKMPSLPIAEKIKPKTLLTYKAVVTLLIRSFFDNGGLFANRTYTLSCYIIAVQEVVALKNQKYHLYLNVRAFSYSGLIDQLEYEGYTAEEAEYAAKNCDADWKEQAVLSAKQYLKTMPFSKDGLIEQLEYEGYTHEQAVYGAEQAYSSASGTSASANSSSSVSTTVGEQNALQSALQYLNSMPFSYTGLIEQLKYEGYSDSEAKYAADNCGADWKEQAVKSAKQYLDIMSFSRQSLIDQLEYEGYTYDQASYAATQNGY